MSPAKTVFPRTPPGVTLILAACLLGDASVELMGESAGHPTGDATCDARLGAASAAALATQAAMRALSTSVADVLPDDPRHAAAYAASDLLRRRWRNEIARVCRLPARGRAGFVAKSVLLSRLVDRDEEDAVLGGPAAEVAASLADDVLAASGLPGS